MLFRFMNARLSSLLAAALVIAVVSPAVNAASPKGSPPGKGASHPTAEADKSKPNGGKEEKKDEKKPETKAETKPEPVLENVVTVIPDELVTKPQEFLGKNVKFNANFFAWSNLALDYKPAFRSSKTHVSFLVLKPNSHIPLSELKLAMMIPKEKDPEGTVFATLKDGDQVELTGKVFSTALDDPWIEVFKLKKLSSSSDDKDKDKDKKASAGSGKGTDSKEKESPDHPEIDKSGTTPDMKKQ